MTKDDQRSDRTEESTLDPFEGIERRDYLKGVGGAGAAGLLGAGASGTGVAQSGDWESAAEDRIQEHRTGDLEVVVRDQNGNPVSDADVSVTQQEHDFRFGTAVHAEFMTRGTEWGEDITVDGKTLDSEDQEKFRQVVKDNFNTIVLENLHKWYLWEQNTDIADEAVQWARDNGKDVRGHVCIWGNVGAWAIPPDVVEAMGDPWASEWSEAGEANKDLDYVRSESMSHIEEIIDYYSDDIFEWEVVNEVLHATSIIEAFEGQGAQTTTAPILGDWYQKAQEVADQHDIDIAVNDYNTFAGAYTNEWDQYETQIDYLVNERNVDLDGVGMQCHHYADERLDTDQMLQAWDKYSQYGAGLRITEFDMFGSGWDPQMQADYMHRLLKMFFSYPDAEQFLVWGFWDPLHWGPELGEDRNAPFFNADWSEKPAFQAYKDLVFDAWWTDEAGSTDSSGTYATTAFLGDHEISVSTSQGEETKEVSVTDSDAVTQVEVTVSAGDSTPDPTTPTPKPSGAQDLDGDGLFEDVNGNGESDFGDVTDLFDRMDSVDDGSKFDFNGNGELDFGDIVDLFNRM